jgi:hypothetical protein
MWAHSAATSHEEPIPFAMRVHVHTTPRVASGLRRWKGSCVSGVRKKLMGRDRGHFVEGQGLECKITFMSLPLQAQWG